MKIFGLEKSKNGKVLVLDKEDFKELLVGPHKQAENIYFLQETAVPNVFLGKPKSPPVAPTLNKTNTKTEKNDQSPYTPIITETTENNVKKGLTTQIKQNTKQNNTNGQTVRF